MPDSMTPTFLESRLITQNYIYNQPLAVIKPFFIECLH